MMSRSSRPVRISVALYRLLIKAYPASFRRAYGAEMAQVFDDLAGLVLLVDRRRGQTPSDDRDR